MIQINEAVAVLRLDILVDGNRQRAKEDFENITKIY